MEVLGCHGKSVRGHSTTTLSLSEYVRRPTNTYKPLRHRSDTYEHPRHLSDTSEYVRRPSETCEDLRKPRIMFGTLSSAFASFDTASTLGPGPCNFSTRCTVHRRTLCKGYLRVFSLVFPCKVCSPFCISLPILTLVFPCKNRT